MSATPPQPPPLPAAEPIELQYAMPDLQPRPTRMLKTLVVLAWLSVALTPPLMKLFDTEVIVGTGAAEAVSGMLVMILSRHSRRTFAVGLAHLVLALCVFLWIFMFEVSPARAHTPVMGIACIGTIALAWPTWKTLQPSPVSTAVFAVPGAGGSG